MHPEFGEWYRLVDPDPTQEVLQNRWAAVESLAGDKSLNFLDVVRVAFCMAPRLPEHLEALRAKFQEYDKTYRMRGNDLENGVLAGALVVHLLETMDKEAADYAALAVVCLACRGSRKNEAGSWLADKAEDHLARSSSNLRRSPAADVGAMPSLNLSAAWKKLKESVGQNDSMGSIGQIEAIVRKVSDTLSKAIGAWQGSMRKQQLYEEELDILWWLVGGISREREVPFNSLDPRELAIVAGRELATLTKVLPGPLAIPAFVKAAMEKAGQSDGQSGVLYGAVNATQREWRKQCTDGIRLDILGPFVPVHVGLAESAKTRGPKQWFGAFEHLTLLKPSVKTTPLDLGMQMYRECLLVRATHEHGEDE